MDTMLLPISSIPPVTIGNVSSTKSLPPISPPPICRYICRLPYFRIGDRKFYVPVSLVVPGSQIPFTRNNDQDKATLDVLGIVTDTEKRPVGQIRDTVKLSVNTSQLVQHKNVQYNSGFVLPPGEYHVKFVVRENQSGRLGSFETDLNVPDLKTVPVKMSSIVLASQLQANTQTKER